MTEIKRACNLIGMALDGFEVKEMFEVVRTDETGEENISLGFLENGKIANGYANCQTDSRSVRTVSRSILTDGKVGFILKIEPIRFIDEKQAKQEIIDKGSAKLSAIERELISGSF
ncbi:MAG TPA: hypothetical protein VK254_02110 [Candidatus Bathyarchaeia archaeon]|nr:hypothetical protein [Candidatus Bathyarchaeia archaeon]